MLSALCYATSFLHLTSGIALVILAKHVFPLPASVEEYRHGSLQRHLFLVQLLVVMQNSFCMLIFLVAVLVGALSKLPGMRDSVEISRLYQSSIAVVCLISHLGTALLAYSQLMTFPVNAWIHGVLSVLYCIETR